jgi:hypothetical protein
MGEIFKSANRLCWAVLLLGAQQFSNALFPSFSGPPVTGKRRRYIGKDGNPGKSHGAAPGSIYDIFLEVQNQTFDLISSVFTADNFVPRQAMKTVFEIMYDSVDIFKAMTPRGDGQIAWHELQNKLQSFYMFEHVDSVLNLPANVRPTLPELLNKASHLGPFLSVWAAEGIGHYYSDWHLAQGRDPNQLLCGENNQNLPLTSLIPLHAGVGLSLAEWSLSATDGNHTEIGALINNFIELCGNNVRTGFYGEAYESLGLASRTLYPHLIDEIDLCLSRMDDALLAYFWHGVGRAIYFAPTNFPPFRNAPWKAVEMCMREPSHKVGQNNALAGFAWALTLVNMRQPEVMATFLKHHEKDIGENDAFANGVCSAALIWQDSSPASADLDAFRDYEPDQSDPSLVELWDKYVRQSCKNALQYHPSVTKHSALGEVFRYQDFPQFIQSLERTRKHLNHSVTDA